MLIRVYQTIFSILMISVISWAQPNPQIMVPSPNVSTILDNHSGFAVFRAAGSHIVVLRLPELTWWSFQESGNVYGLSISPDGSKLAYQRGQNILVRELKEQNAASSVVAQGAEPHWWENEEGQFYLVYETEDSKKTLNSVEEKYPGKTMMIAINGVEKAGEPQELLDQGYKCGMSKDGRWLASADHTPVFYDRQLDKITIAPHSGQTCWPVLSPTDNPEKMDQLTYINTRHDTLLTVNSKKEIVWTYPFKTAPNLLSSAIKWHSLGWSNQENYMCLGIQYPDGIGLALLNRASKDLLMLVNPGPGDQSLIHPDMWLQSSQTSILPMLKNRKGGLVRGQIDILGRNRILTGKQNETKSLPVIIFPSRSEE